MLSNYFKVKTTSKIFDEYICSLLDELKGKRIILYGMGEGFVELNKKYRFSEYWNVTAVTDLRFEKEQTFEGMRAIPPQSIAGEEFDIIVITNESSGRIINYINNVFKIDKEFKTLFCQETANEIQNIEHLEKFGFPKYLEKMKKRLKNKKIVIYDAGEFFKVIKGYYNLDGLNIIAISDKRFAQSNEKEFLGYQAVEPDKIKYLKPDYVIVATKIFRSIIEDLRHSQLKGTKIRVEPILKRSLWKILGEIWSL